MDNILKDKTILITGACGTVGAELIRQLVNEQIYLPKEIIGIDNNESELFFIDQKYIKEKRVNFFVADVRDITELTKKMEGVDIVFHCAALKHVVLCERSPEQAILSNVMGVQNVIEAARANKVERVIFTSSDKAVNPTNVMGTSKLMGERLITAANSNKRGTGPIFSSTRFGNVLGSNGSVIPIFQNQIKGGGPVTLTDRNMTRFVMSIQESVKLVIDSAMYAKGGEVFVTKMPVIRIADLAQAMILELAELYGYKIEEIEVVEIGTKPGEKLYEELMSLEETRRAVETDKYFSVLPAFQGLYDRIEYDYEGLINTTVTNPYVSEIEKYLSIDEIRNLLNRYALLRLPNRGEDTRYWPGDKN
jgi:FlaA1/EpsC-like NDP-sugar epimerase